MCVYRKLGVVFFVFFLVREGSCQSIPGPAAMVWQYGAAVSGLQGDVFGHTRHPGAIASVGGRMAGAYAERNGVPGGPLLLGLAAGMPAGNGAFAFMADLRQMVGYSELQAGLGYGLRLSDNLSTGIRIGYYRLRIDDYGGSGTVVAECGAVFTIAPKLRISLHLFNPTAAGLRSPSAQRLPVAFRAAVGYALSAHCGLALDIVREQGRPVTFQPFLFYEPMGVFRFMSGFSTATMTSFLSAGYRRERMRVDLLVQHHPMLGVTSGIGLQWVGKKKEDK
jgi:hypothetical protein